MSSQRSKAISKKACTRCSTQKRRCDKGLPECGLCSRLHQICRYEVRPLASSGSTLPSPRLGTSFGLDSFTPNHIKLALIRRLESVEPASIISIYSQEVDPWFSIISIPNFQDRLRPSWDESPVDLILLCLSIISLTTAPSPFPENADHPSEFKSLYLSVKSSISLIEGLGINSIELVQARTLVTLFEVLHGLYPAAYISIGATVRAADALVVHPTSDTLTEPPDDEKKRVEEISTWCGILVLDRYLTIESGIQPSLTRVRTRSLESQLKPGLCLSSHPQDHPLHRLGRIFEASAIVDKIHTLLHDTTTEQTFKMNEILTTVATLQSLERVLTADIAEGEGIYSVALILCRTGLLLAFENGSKILPMDDTASNCNSIAIAALSSILSAISDTVGPFILGVRTINFHHLPPFIAFLVYKAATIVTEWMWISDPNEGLRKLRILRGFLKLIGKRWLSCERYLKLLNEDTTPRILKAIEQD